MRLLALSVAAALLLPSAITASETASADAQSRIANAFTRLGMAESMAVCYGGAVGDNLSQEESLRAASIVEAASDGEEVREGVTQSSGNIISAFSYARSKCGY